MLIVNNWIGADPSSDTMHYIDVDWHTPVKQDDKWVLTFSVNDNHRPCLGRVVVDDADVNGSYGTRQIVPGCAIRRRGGEWALRYLVINGTDYTVKPVPVGALDDSPVDLDAVYEAHAYFTSDVRTLDDGTVERSFWVRSGDFGRDYFWVRYPLGIELEELSEGTGSVTVKFRSPRDDEAHQANSSGFLLTDSGEYEIVTDEPRHLLTRAPR